MVVRSGAPAWLAAALPVATMCMASAAARHWGRFAAWWGYTSVRLQHRWGTLTAQDSRHSPGGRRSVRTPYGQTQKTPLHLNSRYSLEVNVPEREGRLE
jgi:hypothetical protein